MALDPPLVTHRSHEAARDGIELARFDPRGLESLHLCEEDLELDGAQPQELASPVGHASRIASSTARRACASPSSLGAAASVVWNMRSAEPSARTFGARGLVRVLAARSMSNARVRASARGSAIGSGTASGKAARGRRSDPKTTATPIGTSDRTSARRSSCIREWESPVRKAVNPFILSTIEKRAAPDRRQRNRANGVELRRYERTPIDVAVTFSRKASAGAGGGASAETASTRWDGRATDISLGGMFVATSTPLPFGSEAVVTIGFPNERGMFSLLGVVRWTREGGMGIQFGLLARARRTRSRTRCVHPGSARRQPRVAVLRLAEGGRYFERTKGPRSWLRRARSARGRSRAWRTR